MRPQLLFRKIHKWLGLIISIQLLLWFISGFLMSWMPIEEIHGDHLLKTHQMQTVNLPVVNLAALTNHINKPISSARIIPWLGNTVVEIKTESESFLFDAETSLSIAPINEQLVRAVIDYHIIPAYTIDSMQLLDQTPAEARGRKAPLWQVQLSGPENPRIYVSTTGEIVAKRTDRWRLFDFLWMLHIMDYDEREDFNHPLLYLTALSALLFTLTGLVLLCYSLKRKN